MYNGRVSGAVYNGGKELTELNSKVEFDLIALPPDK